MTSHAKEVCQPSLMAPSVIPKVLHTQPYMQLVLRSRASRLLIHLAVAVSLLQGARNYSQSELQTKLISLAFYNTRLEIYYTHICCPYAPPTSTITHLLLMVGVEQLYKNRNGVLPAHGLRFIFFSNSAILSLSDS